MKKIVTMICTILVLCLGFTGNTFAAGVKELTLANYVDVEATQMVISPKGDMLLIFDSYKKLHLFNLVSGIKKELEFDFYRSPSL